MKIRNINGTSDANSRCVSLLASWEKFSGQPKPFYCPVNTCIKLDIVGARVQKGGESTDRNWYIYPLCGHHTTHEGELEVSIAYKLVPAGEKATAENDTEDIGGGRSVAPVDIVAVK